MSPAAVDHKALEAFAGKVNAAFASEHAWVAGELASLKEAVLTFAQAVAASLEALEGRHGPDTQAKAPAALGELLVRLDVTTSPAPTTKTVQRDEAGNITAIREERAAS